MHMQPSFRIPWGIFCEMGAAFMENRIVVMGGRPLNGAVCIPAAKNSVPTKTIIKYGELIEEATGGAVKCDVQYGGTLGNDAEAIESTRMGTIDLIFAGTSGFTSFYDKAQGYGSAFLFTSAEEANEVLNSTDIGEQIFADFGDYGSGLSG